MWIKLHWKADMQVLNGEMLIARLHQLVPDASFTSQQAGQLLQEFLFPVHQTRGNLNSTVRRFFQEDYGTDLRKELVILQVLIRSHGIAQVFRSVEQLVEIYGFNYDDVIDDQTLPVFDWYMGFALELVQAKNQMDFIIHEVVVPLSENGNPVNYVSGGGTETVQTSNRYFIYEHRSRCYRPKTQRRLEGRMPPPYLHSVGQLAPQTVMEMEGPLEAPVETPETSEHEDFFNLFGDAGVLIGDGVIQAGFNVEDDNGNGDGGLIGLHHDHN